MKVAVIGSGGREHAIALRLSKDKNLSELYCIPGNPGTEIISTNVPIDIDDSDSILKFCKYKKIDLVIIGPEQPLVSGLSELLRNNDIKVFGPSSKAARIESSKTFAKQIMGNANVQTASYKEFTYAEFKNATMYLNNCSYPIVLKADGLAAGKGVIICNSNVEALTAIKEIFIDKIFSESGNKIIVEEFLEGEEASVFAITDGKKFVCLPAAQDHKRIGDNDTGKNTGGMGAYAPAPIVDSEMIKKIENEIITPTLTELYKTGNKFIGCLYAGLMITKSGPKVIEFNCRFGDPETQVVLPLLEGSLVDLLYSAASENLNENAVEYSGGASVCVVAASKGYPDSYKKGFEINGLSDVDNDIIIYHAGTKKVNDKIVTNGGRVLGVTSVVKNFDLVSAQKKVYSAIKRINFDGIYYRKDIASKAFKYIK
jgi:phosphoribosylamine--glycine ligase